ncbi:NAD(P)-binding protein [Lojkania enalia]|uniref:NAD(P)-binding protein n=1 Tax=Lojkania enalia TaxID=147567 RepID=A0A9P4KD39_9PLEO|nr:NAD(P)-binding protein [Didymosphaeria enalia]
MVNSQSRKERRRAELPILSSCGVPTKVGNIPRFLHSKKAWLPLLSCITISDSDLEGIKDQVVIVTGASSGIGLATVKRLIQHGAKVFVSDLQELPEPERSQIPFLETDVTSWSGQVALFKAAKDKYGVIHHVFANAGISSGTALLGKDVDDNGNLLPPDLKVINVNLIGLMYTVKLGIHYIKQNPKGGSIVMAASASSFTRFAPSDYTTSKHGVYGLLRSLYCTLYPNMPVRINAIAPSWTDTGIISADLIEAVGKENVQSPDVPARSVIALMADKNRHGQMIYSQNGKFWDIENGENGLVAHTDRMIAEREPGWEQESVIRLTKLRVERAAVAEMGKS